MNRLIVASLAATSAAVNLKDRTHYETKFYDWLQEFKVQIKDGQEFAHMLQNFANNEDFIATTNSKNLSYELGHNKFSHLSYDEWVNHVRLGLGKPAYPPSENIHEAPKDVSSLATSVDWNAQGKVTPVKDQGQCGSCWSFSATGALEGAYLIKKATNDDGWTGFSEQQLVSCDQSILGDHGCNGGLMDNAFKWIEGNNGLCSETTYPYTSGVTKENGVCQTTCAEVSGSDIKTYTDVQKNSDSALMSALNLQPVSVAIQANQPAFQFYKTGVITADCGTKLDHGVLAVGYGTWSDGTEYYQVKNSWGPTWGMNGYVLIERNSGQTGGMCGILSGPPSYPTVF